MLISRKVAKDKRTVTDVWYLNEIPAKYSFAYPLLRDTFLDEMYYLF